jgi:triacylglycerol lipase
LDIGHSTFRGSRLPILLAHGICPFHRMIPLSPARDNAEDDRFHYFRKIRSTLISNGFLAFHSRVSWASSIEKRASDLQNEILRITDGFSRWPGVHIIGHSMGGLDARFMIYRYRMERRVVSLTTIGTPHLGTAYADWGLKRFGMLIDMARPLCLDLAGFRDLTRDQCQRLNRRLADFEDNNGVRYQTVAGVQPIERIFWPMRFSYRIITKEEGENDGLVSLRSAMWKKEYFLFKMGADHINQIGWWDRSKVAAGMDRETFEAYIRDIYLKIAGGLGE